MFFNLYCFIHVQVIDLFKINKGLYSYKDNRWSFKAEDGNIVLASITNSAPEYKLVEVTEFDNKPQKTKVILITVRANCFLTTNCALVSFQAYIRKNNGNRTCEFKTTYSSELSEKLAMIKGRNWDSITGVWSAPIEEFNRVNDLLTDIFDSVNYTKEFPEKKEAKYVIMK